MAHEVELLCGLLDQDDPAFVAQADFDGALEKAIRSFQELGFLSRQPAANPVPFCVRCEEGVPYRVGNRLVCNACRRSVNPRELEVWPLDRAAVLSWLAAGLNLNGGVRRVGHRLWQLGTWTGAAGPCECFFLHGTASAFEQARLRAYRNAVVLFGSTPPAELESPPRLVSLLGLLRNQDSRLTLSAQDLFRPHGAVRFEGHSGALWAGSEKLGEVPVGSKEYYFLRSLAADLDHFVAYADLKRAVLSQTGGRDASDEATFCQGLKSRIKRKWVPQIDALIATTNKADGYRLRGHAGP